LHVIVTGFVLLTVATALGLSQESVPPGSSQGLTTAEMHALDSQGNPKKRAEKAIKLANEKADEARKNALKGNSAEAENAAKGFETALNHAWSDIEQAEGQGADMTDTIAKVSEATAKHTDKLSEVLDRVPEQAKPHIEHAMEVSQRGHDHALDALEKAATQQSDPRRRASRLLDVADGRAMQVREATARGNSEDARRAAQGYERALAGALNAVDVGQQQGDMETVMNRVAEATTRHQGTLQEVKGRVPQEAQAAIDHAMEVSRKGHDTALANLEQARGHQAAAGGGYGSGAGQAPAGAGANSPMGPPAGMGGSGRGGGPPAGVGGGRP
jgi:hypothetical protein